MSTSTPPHEIISITPQDLQNNADNRIIRDQCYSIREQVFHQEQGFPLDTEFDEYDETSTHILLRLVPSLEPVGTIRVVIHPHGYYKLTRLAVLKQYRQFKFGRELVEALHNSVRIHAENNAPTSQKEAKVVSHSQIYVKSFYAKFGYKPEGPKFDEDGAPHQKMVLKIPIHQ